MSVRACVAALLLLAGCDRQQMEDSPRFETFEAAEQFGDSSSARTPPQGAVPWQAPWTNTQPAAEVSITPELLARGRDRHDIYCAPCHGYTGAGDGMVVRRGFPAPPSYQEARLLAAGDRQLYDAITNGAGIMFPFGGRITPGDRLAIVAYIRALQLSQHAAASALPPEARRRLERTQAPRP